MYFLKIFGFFWLALLLAALAKTSLNISLNLIESIIEYNFESIIIGCINR